MLTHSFDQVNQFDFGLNATRNGDDGGRRCVERLLYDHLPNEREMFKLSLKVIFRVRTSR